MARTGEENTIEHGHGFRVKEEIARAWFGEVCNFCMCKFMISFIELELKSHISEYLKLLITISVCLFMHMCVNDMHLCVSVCTYVPQYSCEVRELPQV